MLGDLRFPMGKNSPPRKKVWAVIRVDRECASGNPEWCITVKEIVRTHDIALAEVERLNDLNGERFGCHYFIQMTRLFADGESFGTHPDDDAPVA